MNRNVIEEKYKRIWFKPDCVRWIPRLEKTTTFRGRAHNGLYEVVRGSWFDNEPVGLRLKLTPTIYTSGADVINNHYKTEGPFNSATEFLGWLEEVRLSINKDKVHFANQHGWLHDLEVV